MAWTGWLVAAPIDDAFEGPEPSWRLTQAREVRFLQQQRIRIDRDEQVSGVEWLRYACRPGYSGVYWRPIGRAPILDEFIASLAVRCEAPGAVLGARVVLPRSIDPKTGQPITAMLRGERSQTAGDWQTLRLTDVPGKTADAARLLRTRPGSPSIDDAGAFIDRLVLLLPGSESPVSVWIDDLRVEGVVFDATEGAAASEGVEGPLLLPTANSPRVPTEERVKLDAAGFTIGGRPFFPRVWSFRGGPLKVIRETGFNTVAFDQPPSTEQLVEAAKNELRVICPPPPGNAADPTARIDPNDWAPVLAWRVGGGSLDAARAFADRTRRVDLALERPLIAEVDADWSAWSRVVDGIVISRTGPRNAAADRLWSERVQDVARLARPGTPILQQVFTGPGIETNEQLAAFAGPIADRSSVGDRRLADDVLAAIADRAVGVWFIGANRLSGADAVSTRLRGGLTLLNLRLDLIDPWLAGGERGPLVRDDSGNARGVLLKRGRVWLVTPLPGAAAAAPGGKLVTPGAGESTLAYRLSPAGLTPLRVDRVAGGVTFDASAVGDWTMAVVTGDRSAANAIARRVAKTAKPSVDLQLRLARDELSRFSNAVAAAPTTVERGHLRRRTEQSISLANAAAAAGRLEQAFAAASVARILLSRSTDTSPRGDPLLQTPLDSLSGFSSEASRLAGELDRLLAGAPRGANLLAGGDFEDLEETRRAGWINTSLPGSGVDAGVELSAHSPGHGRRALRLMVSPQGDSGSRLAAGDCPVWVTSPVTKLNAGQLIEVMGWVRIEPHSSDQPPRLVISDTLGGEQLGRVVDQAETWRPFRLLRRATRDAELRVTFGLSGVGAAGIDAVMIRPVQVGATPIPPAELGPAPPVALQRGRGQPK